MEITLNPDKEIVKAIKEGLDMKGGYCPCRVEINEDILPDNVVIDLDN